MRRILIAAALAAGLSGAAVAQEIPIGTIGPMTGGDAAFGKQMKDGAEQAIADINAAGGVNGKKLRLIVEDDACDPKQAVAGAAKLVGQKVKFVAGHYCSSSSIPASKIYAEEGIVQITPASTNPKLTDERSGPGVFRVVGRDDQQGAVAGKWLAEKFKGKNVAILHDKTTYGQGLADETKKGLNANGLKETMYEAYTRGEKDFSALISKLKQANIDVVYVGGYHNEVGLIIRQMRDQGLKALLVSGDALVTQEFWQITGPAGEGTLMTFAPDPRKNPAAKDVVAKFKAKNIEPEGYVLYAYAAIQVWAEAANAAKSEDFKAVVDKLNSMTFKTVIGDLKYDKKGDLTNAEYVWYVWKNGNYSEVTN